MLCGLVEAGGRAMDDLVRLMTPVLWHVVRAYGLDAQLSEDVVQVTWLTLVRRHDTIHDARAVAGWLTTAVISGVIGVVVGGLIALVLHHAMRLKPGAGH